MLVRLFALKFYIILHHKQSQHALPKTIVKVRTRRTRPNLSCEVNKQLIVLTDIKLAKR